MSPFLAIDWGTTNRRVYRIEGGAVAETARDGLGVTAMKERDYGAELAALRKRFGDLPVLMAGMVGSTIGWRELPYVALPAGFEALAAGLLWLDERTVIVPGLKSDSSGRADVMRGEEVQLLGAVAAGLVPEEALLCQPGTHCKWALLRGQAVIEFVTAMTGELYALLRHHSVLGLQLAGEAQPGAAFRAGVKRGSGQDLAAALFEIRALGMFDRLSPEDAPSYASGLLIGSDVAMRLAQYPGQAVNILADPTLGALYRSAVETLGRTASLIDSKAAFVAGITAIWEQIQ